MYRYIYIYIYICAYMKCYLDQHRVMNPPLSRVSVTHSKSRETHWSFDLVSRSWVKWHRAVDLKWPVLLHLLPSGKDTKSIKKLWQLSPAITMFNGKINYFYGPCSIATLVIAGGRWSEREHLKDSRTWTCTSQVYDPMNYLLYLFTIYLKVSAQGW